MVFSGCGDCESTGLCRQEKQEIDSICRLSLASGHAEVLPVDNRVDYVMDMGSEDYFKAHCPTSPLGQ